MNLIEKIIKRYIGEVRYILSIINVSGEVKQLSFNSKEDLDKFVDDINDEKYWMIQKIEKIRNLEFSYNGNVIHKPLFFHIDNICEKRIINENTNIELSFLKKDQSLNNVTYTK